jgi:uncharacterized protein involved in exopolysaccharide biosynthesis
MRFLDARTNFNPAQQVTVEGKPAAPGGFARGAHEPPRFRPQILRSLRMHRKLAFAVGILVCSAMLLLGFQEGWVYQAESLIYIEPIMAHNINDQGTPGFDSLRYDSYVQQQIQTVTRPDILTAALESLPADAWHVPGESKQSAVARLQRALVVERVPGYQISIKLTTPKPAISAAIVNAVTNAYLRGGRRDEVAEADQREQLLDEERQRIKNELDTDRKEQAALGNVLGEANPASQTQNPFDADTANLRTELATARQAHDVAAAQLSSVSGQEADQRSGLAAAADEALITDPGLSQMKASVSARRALLESDKAGLTPGNPRYRQDQDEIADLDRSLDSMSAQLRQRTERRIQDKLRTELERTASVESTLNAQLAQETAKATGAGPKLQRASELAADIERLTTRYATIDDALRGLQLETNGPGMAHLALAAAVPAMPEPNHRKLFVLLAIPLGMIAGIAAAVLARARDRRVFLGDDLEQVIGFAPMAVLPAASDVPDRVVNEYLLRLAAAVEDAYRSASARTFVITAVSPRTDTATLVRALAQKLEDLRLKVQVIPASGLLVTSAETAEHQLQAASAEARGEGIASAKLDRMKAESDLVLIDAAPLLHSAAAEYAARCADATILIAESGVTLSTELEEATSLLSRLHVSGVGVVLQELRLENADAAFKSAIQVVEQRSLEGLVDRKLRPRREQPLTPDVAEDPVVSAPADRPESVPQEVQPPGNFPVAAVARQEVQDDPRKALRPMPKSIQRPSFIAPAVASDLLQPVGQRNQGPRNWKQEIAAKPFTADRSPWILIPEKQGDTPAVTARKPEQFVPGVLGVGSATPTNQEVAFTAVGHRLAENERNGALPSYTRSKIRLAFKEQEMSGKNKWFSKLFRGDQPADFKIVPEDEEDQPETPLASGREASRRETNDRPSDPDLQYLLARINSVSHQDQREQMSAEAASRQETHMMPTPRPAPAPLPGIVERQAAPAFPATPVAEPEIQPQAPLAEPQSNASRPVRPGRPLSFLQLTGHESVESAPGPRPQPQVSPEVLVESWAHETPSSPSIPLWPEKQAAPESTFSPSIAQPNISRIHSQRPEPVHVATSIPPIPAAELEAVDSDVVTVDQFSYEIPEIAQLPLQAPPTQNTGPSSRLEAKMDEHMAPLQGRAFLPDPTTDPAPSSREYRLDSGTRPVIPRPEFASTQQPKPEFAASPQTEFADRRKPQPERDPNRPTEQVVRPQRRRRTDQIAEPAGPNLTRRWALLSRFESVPSDPEPASRASHENPADVLAGVSRGEEI